MLSPVRLSGERLVFLEIKNIYSYHAVVFVCGREATYVSYFFGHATGVWKLVAQRPTDYSSFVKWFINIQTLSSIYTKVFMRLGIFLKATFFHFSILHFTGVLNVVKATTIIFVSRDFRSFSRLKIACFCVHTWPCNSFIRCFWQINETIGFNHCKSKRISTSLPGRSWGILFF